MSEPGYGLDLSLADGFERTFPVAEGRRNLVRAIFRRLTTSATSEAGTEIYVGKCLDVRDYFAARMDPQRVAQVARAVERTSLYDERIAGATCKATFNFSRKRLELAINLTPAVGPTFTLILGANNVTVEILNGDNA